jgi:hypothetical protein
VCARLSPSRAFFYFLFYFYYFFFCIVNVLQGEVVYYGPPSRLIEFFSSIGYNIPANTNPADFARAHISSSRHLHLSIHLFPSSSVIPSFARLFIPTGCSGGHQSGSGAG